MSGASAIPKSGYPANMAAGNFEIPVFSGLGDGMFDAGVAAIEKMIDALPALAEADLWRHWQWEKVTDAILARARRYGPPTVITIGHSMGVDAQCKMAWRLHSAGMKVAYMAAIDPTAGRVMRVPPNVLRVDEFWSDPGWFGRIFNAPYRARQARPDGSRGGKLIRTDGGKPIVAAGTSHVGCAAAEITRTTIRNRVAELIQ